MKHSKIAIIIGTKAELIKCMPVMLELQKKKQDYWFIHTGQHPLKRACEDFGVKYPDFILSEEPDVSTKFWSKMNNNSILWNFSMVFKIRRLVRKLKPKYVLYHGDTMSTADAAIGSSKIFNLAQKTWKNVHLEAGLRSGSLLEPMPEEISRQICDKFSDILLAVSDRTEKNLLKKYKREKVFKTGNTVVDSAEIVYDIAKRRSKKMNYDYALVNIHRHENLKSEKRMRQIVEILKSVESKAIWPLHDNTRYHLEKYGLMKEIEKMKNIKITGLTDYFNFIFMIANCKYLITDGGSIQEESLVFKKPCVILRNVTERQEGLPSGINFLTKMNVLSAKKVIRKIENNELDIRDFKNPYGKPGVSKKIVEMLLE